MNTHDIEYLVSKLKRRGLTVYQIPTVGEPEGFMVKTKGGYLKFMNDLTLYAYKQLPITDIYICSFSGVTQLGRFIEDKMKGEEFKL